MFLRPQIESTRNMFYFYFCTHVNDICGLSGHHTGDIADVAS